MDHRSGRMIKIEIQALSMKIIESRLSWISQNPLLFYITITFFIAYVLGIPFNMILSGLIGERHEVAHVLVPRTVTVYAPAIAAIIVSYASWGKAGVKLLMQKLVPQKNHFLYWLFVPLGSICLTVTCYSISGLDPGEFLTSVRERPWLLLLHFVVQFFIVGIGEETGWRGFLLPLCKSRYRFFTAIAMVTFIWGIWHFPLLFQDFAFVYPWILILISMSMILTWLWIKTNCNLFVLALAHASANASQSFFENRLIEKNIAKEHLLAGWEILGYGYLFIALTILLIDFNSFRDDDKLNKKR